MKHIAINDAFHRLVDGGLSVEAAWRKLTNSDLQMWCDGNLIVRDYVVNCLRIAVRDGNIIVMPAGPLGWEKPPSEYTFTIDAAKFEQLLARKTVGRPPKLTVNALADEIAERRRTGRSTVRKVLARHFDVGPSTIDRFRKKKSPK